MFLYQEVSGTNLKKCKLSRLRRKKLQEIFGMVHGVPSSMDLIERDRSGKIRHVFSLGG